MYTTSIRFRKWRREVLDQWQRSDLPVVFKGPRTRGRALIYYGSLLLATVYVISMLQFNLPSARYMDPAFKGCRRGPQYASSTILPPFGNEPLGPLAGGERDIAAGSSPTSSLASMMKEDEDEILKAPSLAYGKYYHFQGLYVPAVPPPKHRFEGRGIVITASGRIAGQAIGAFVTAYILRKVLDCRLPIEIFFVGPRETFGAKLHAKLRELGDIKILSLPAILRKDTFYQENLKHLHVADRRLRSYAAKPYAMYACAFEEAMLFDAGVIPFTNPESFFAFEGYESNGYHLFRDYRELDRKSWSFVENEFCADINELHTLLEGTEADSSCVIAHKIKAWDSLLVTMAMNGPLQPFTYNRLNGDKDTWVLASSITYQNFSTSHTTPGYFMREADPDLTLVDAAYTGWAQPLRGHVQFVRNEKAPGGVIPLYLNNQRLNMTEYPQLKQRLAFGLWEDYGYPFCGWRTVNPLLRPPPQVFQVLDAVAVALEEVEASDECLCKWFRCRYPAPFSPDWPYAVFRR